MDDIKYEVIQSYIESASYNVLILKIPKKEVNDKLTFLTREKGLIAKSLYDDFLIATCITNINDFLQHINQKEPDLESLNTIRRELVKKIVRVNVDFDSSNLIINDNHVVKIKNTVTDKQSFIPLIKNEFWDKDLYEGNIQASKDRKTLDRSKIKNVKDLKYTMIQKFWRRIGQYIVIKQFEKGSEQIILSERSFNTRSAFEQYVVTVCVEEIEDLFMKLDTLGLPQRVSAPTLMHELFELCKDSNPFLDFNLYKSDFDKNEEFEEDDDVDPFSSFQQTAQVGSEEGSSPQKKRLKLFKHIKKATLLELGIKIKNKIIGQDDAIDDIVDAIQRSSVGLKSVEQPIGSFLFTGPTGCGKTESAKILAEELIGNRRGLVTIDCSEYSADHEYAKLIGCFIPGSKVLMGNGSLKNIENIKIGEQVITHKGRIKEVEKTYEYNQRGEMLKIQVANSSIPITTTKTHEILAIKHSNCTKGESNSYRVCKPTCVQAYCVDPPHENYKLEWLPAEELKVNDIVAYPKYKPTGIFPKKLDLVDYIKDETRYKYDDEYVWAQKHIKVPRYIEVNEDLMRLSGYYVSEGGINGDTGNGINFTFNSKETSYIIETVKLLRKLFGSEIRIRIQDRSKDHSYRIYAGSKIVCNFMSELFGHNTYVKRVPEWFKDLPDEHIKNFLETAVFGDGGLTVSRRMDYSTVSSALFSQMQLMFRRLGYITSVYLEKNYQKNLKHKDRYRIYIGGNQIEKLNEEFDFNIDLSGMKQTNIQRKCYIDDDYIYCQIKNIEKVDYNGKVYDLSVKDDVSYVVEIIAHNSPQGYVGWEQGGYLTNAIKKRPFSIVLFDEIEKASEKVHQLLLQIMDEARLRDGKGKAVSFRDVIVIMTSNIGVDEVKSIGKTIGMGSAREMTFEKRKTAIEKALKKKFKPEFLNRITSMVSFKTLSKENYINIIKLELDKLKLNLKLNRTEYSNLDLNFDKSLYNYIYKKGIDERYGARPLKRAIEKEISTPLARKLLSEKINNDSKIFISIERGNKLKIEIKPSKVERKKSSVRMKAGNTKKDE